MDRFIFILLFALLMVYAEQSTSLNLHTLSLNATDDKGNKMSKYGTANTSLKSKGSPFSSNVPASAPMPSNNLNSDTKSFMPQKESNETHKTPSLAPPTDWSQRNKTHQINETQEGHKISTAIGNQQWCNYSSKCTDQRNLFACLHVLKNGSTELIVFNDGEDELSVNLTAIVPAHFEALQFELKKHQKKEIVRSGIMWSVSKIILNAGNGDCVINQTRSSSWIKSYGDVFPSSYTFLITPTYGACFLAVVVFAVGGICVCCKLRRKRQRHGGVRYHELEMGPPESDYPATTPMGKLAASDPTDGWDHTWDDDWEEDDEDQPRGRRGNGHGSNTLEDGWDDKWDD